MRYCCILISFFCLSFNTDCLVDYNRRIIGIREETGNNDGLQIQRLLNACGLVGSYEYCAATVLSGHKQCEFDFPTVKSCRSDSWFVEGRICYQRGDSKSLIKEGQVVGYWIRSKGRIGHNGTIISVNLERNYALIVEGNTDDRGNTIQPGQGVHLLRRSLDEITATSDWQNKNVVRYHIVQPKETLYRLSLMYKTTVQELIRVNNLDSNILSIGQKINVK